jgi:hypothetical protein
MKIDVPAGEEQEENIDDELLDAEELESSLKLP